MLEKPKHPINTILHTKDGRKIGNAIVISNEGIYNNVKTDYGNEVRLTDREIDELFYVAYSEFSEEEKYHLLQALGKHKHAK